MHNKRLVVIGHGFKTEEVFRELFDEVLVVNRYIPITLEVGDVVMFEGGADINSYLYDEEPNGYVGYPSMARDAYEQMIFRQAKHLGVPMIGICRGAQLVCALSGGKLVQHVTNHGVDHYVSDYKGRSYMVTSSHHQMMLPAGTKHKVLASCKRSKKYLGEFEKHLDVKEDVEIVWFEDTKCLAIQGHPEWAAGTDFEVHCQEYVKDFIQGE